MRLPFTREKPKKRGPRTTFASKKEREDYKREKAERDLVHNNYIQLLRSDPELLKQTVAKTYGLNMKAVDPVELRRKKVQDKVTELALEKLENDPDFAERMVQAEADRIVSEGTGFDYNEEDGNHYPRSPFEDLEETLDLAERIKDRLGKGTNGGTLDTILNSKLVESLGPLLGQMIAAQQFTQPPPPPIHRVVQPPQATPIAEAPPPPPPPPKSEEQIKEEAMTQEVHEESPNILSWLTYLEDVPEVFVSDLYKFADEGNIMAQGLLDMLQSKTAETIMAEIQPFKEQNDDFKMFIEALEAQPWWLESVIKLIRGEEESE